MPLDSLLTELRGKGFQMAIVVDEYGGTAGITNLEDLVEELVGEVADEHDRSRAGIVSTTDHLTFPGSLRPDELQERAGIVVPEDENYETVAGFVLSLLGRIPQHGDTVHALGGEFTVIRMDGRRIDRIRFTPDPTPEEGEGDE
jgi:CBS domain containing-hemolysin-like protein